MTPHARAVQRALQLCDDLADQHRGKPVSVATFGRTHRSPLTPVPVGRGAVSLHVDSDGVIVIAAVKGDPHHLSAVAVPFPLMADGLLPDAARIESRTYRVFVGAALNAALAVVAARDGAPA